MTHYKVIDTVVILKLNLTFQTANFDKKKIGTLSLHRSL